MSMADEAPDMIACTERYYADGSSALFGPDGKVLARNPKGTFTLTQQHYFTKAELEAFRATHAEQVAE